MTIETKEDVNERFPSGYYLENGKDKLINGIDHTIRELNGKELKKIPSVIICTKNKNGSSYVSNRDRLVDSFETIQSHYKKVIDKKDYFYDFSKFYYIENEGGKGPSKVVLHNKDFDYNGWKYNSGNLTKKLSGNLTAKKIKLIKIGSILDKNVTGNVTINKIIKVTNDSDSTISFDVIDNDIEVSDYQKIIKINGNTALHPTDLYIKFYFHGLFIKGSEDFKVENNSIVVSANYYKPIKEIGTIIKPENCQYGIYRLRNNRLYDVNKYIALKFDELAALPTNITDFYTRKPTDSYGDPAAVATLLNNPQGTSPDDNVANIIQPKETITEVYVINYY